MTDKNGWPKKLYMSASSVTGKIYGHLDTATYRQEYVHPSEIKELTDKLKRCKGALRFYADRENYHMHAYLGQDVGFVPAERGELARSYFQSIQEPKDDQ